MLHHMQLHQLPQNGHQNPYTNINSTATSQHEQVPILKRFSRALLICDHRKLSSFLPQGSKIESFSSNNMWCQLHLHGMCSIQGEENKKGIFWKWKRYEWPKTRKESLYKYVSGGWRHRCGDPEKSRKVGMGEKTRVGLQYLICFNLCLWQKKKFSVLFLTPSANVQVLISSFMISGTGARSVIRGLQARWSWWTTWAALSTTI